MITDLKPGFTYVWREGNTWVENMVDTIIQNRLRRVKYKDGARQRILDAVKGKEPKELVGEELENYVDIVEAAVLKEELR